MTNSRSDPAFRRWLEYTVLEHLEGCRKPWSSTDIAHAIKQDYRQTLATLHHLERVDKVEKAYFPTSNLTVWWLKGNI